MNLFYRSLFILVFFLFVNGLFINNGFFINNGLFINNGFFGLKGFRGGGFKSNIIVFDNYVSSMA